MKLFVAKLPQNVTSERLKAMFETYGSVLDAKVISDRDTGMSKCYGFVEMATSEAAQEAIEKLNGIEMDGKEVLVKESDPAPRSNDRGGGGRGGPRPGGRPSFNSGGGGGDRRSSGPRPGGDRWGGGGGGSDDRSRSSNRYQDNDRSKKRYDDDYDDKPRRKRI